MWKLLVVDDNFTNRQLIIDMLEDKAQCDIATNGKEAIEAYNHSIKNQNRYDLILLDISMPEMDGLQFLVVIREHEKAAGIQVGNGIPIIMVTAFKQSFLEAFNRGCDDYILKPVNPGELVSKITAKLGEPNDGKNPQTSSTPAPTAERAEDMFEKNSKELKISCDAYKRILTKSCTQNEEHVINLENAIEEVNYEKIQFAAHSLKGAYGNLRIKDIAQPAEEIDTLARAQDDVEKMKAPFAELKQALKELKTKIT